MFWNDAEIIHSYSRSQAIEDGMLIDVSEMAAEARIKFPVALTAEVFQQCVQVPPKVRMQDPAGRLWDILWMFSLAARRARGSVIHFEVLIKNNNRPGMPKPTRLKAICGPGDDADPVITIMFPHED